jgi:hypothetical protein
METIKLNLKNRGFDTQGKTQAEILQAMKDLLGMSGIKRNKEIAQKLSLA